jgi:hypothetical protein
MVVAASSLWELGDKVSQRHRTTQGPTRQRKVERAMGIEPTAQAWEAWVLPLYDARAASILVAPENAWQIPWIGKAKGARWRLLRTLHRSMRSYLLESLPPRAQEQ